MDDYLTAANDPILWFFTIPTIAMVVLQAVLFVKYSYKASPLVKLNRNECKTAFKIGCVSAIGPAFGVVTVMLGMIAILGTPITWQRLSMVGNAQQEMMMATIGAQVYGTEIGAKAYGIEQFIGSVWMQTLHGCNWMIAVILVLHKMEDVRTKLSKHDINLLPIIGSAALAGVIAMLGITQAKGSNANVISLLLAAGYMVLLQLIGKKVNKIKEYSVGLAMLASMLTTQLIVG